MLQMILLDVFHSISAKTQENWLIGTARYGSDWQN